MYVKRCPRRQLVHDLLDAYAQIDDLLQVVHRRNRKSGLNDKKAEFVGNDKATPVRADREIDQLGLLQMLGGLAKTNAEAAAYQRLCFNVSYYLRENPDLQGAVSDAVLTDPFQHWVSFGWREGRSASFRPDRLMATACRPSGEAAVKA